MTSKFRTNDLVWAKMRYSPTWPAKVIDPPAGKQRKKCCYVFFFGTESVGWVKENDVWPYNLNYPEQVQRGIKNQMYTKAVKKIAEIYHEEVQLKSPAFKKIKLDEQAENVEEPVHTLDATNEKDYDFLNAKKPKRTKEEEEARQKKIQERLKVRLFPKKGMRKDKKKKQKKNSKHEKPLPIEAANDASPTISSSIPLSSSSIITVNVRDYKKLIPREAVVLLRRCDKGLQSLASNAEEQAGSDCPPEKPPALSPEL